ncbi:unnamed protein product [Discula destructiva]
MADAPMDNAPPHNGMENAPPFSEQEREILDMYDQVQKLELELALTRARVRLAEDTARNPGKHQAPQTDDENTKDIQSARAQLLDAMALHNLRASVVTNVLITNPLLKGIHNSTYASPIEQDLHPWIAARDTAAQAVAAQAGTLRQTLDRLSEVEADARRAAARNRELAAEVLQLAAAAGRDGAEAVDADEGARARIVELEGTLARSRQRWRVVKGTASGIVAGSGVDWVADEDLVAVVLDPE